MRSNQASTVLSERVEMVSIRYWLTDGTGPAYALMPGDFEMKLLESMVGGTVARAEVLTPFSHRSKRNG